MGTRHWVRRIPEPFRHPACRAQGGFLLPVTYQTVLLTTRIAFEFTENCIHTLPTGKAGKLTFPHIPHVNLQMSSTWFC